MGLLFDRKKRPDCVEITKKGLMVKFPYKDHGYREAIYLALVIAKNWKIFTRSSGVKVTNNCILPEYDPRKDMWDIHQYRCSYEVKFEASQSIEQIKGLGFNVNI